MLLPGHATFDEATCRAVVQVEVSGRFLLYPPGYKVPLACYHTSPALLYSLKEHDIGKLGPVLKLLDSLEFYVEIQPSPVFFPNVAPFQTTRLLMCMRANVQASTASSPSSCPPAALGPEVHTLAER